ncbi:MAG: PP2C family protein-serine/threonine phosphatase, partial [bacterium]
MKNRRYSEIWLIALAGAGLLAAFWLFPKTYPQAGAPGTKSRHEIIHQAETVLDHVNFSRQGLEPIIDFHVNRELLAFGQVNFGAAEANRMFARDLPAFFWNVRYGKPSLLKAVMSSGSEEERIEKALEQHLRGEARLQFDIHGRLLLLDLNDKSAPDSLGLNAEEAQALAFGLLPFSPLSDTSGIALEKSQVMKQKKRVDYMMLWKAPAPMVGLKTRIDALVEGAQVRRWQLLNAPIAATSNFDLTFPLINRLLAGLVMLIAVGIFFFKKLRADEMSLKAGLPAAIAAALGMALVYLTDTTLTLVGQLASAILTPGFVILGLVILYGTGESLMRNLGQERLLSFEAVQHGRWWFRPVGKSLSRGAAWGLILFGGVTLILNRVAQPAQAYFMPPTSNDALMYYTSVIPSLAVWGENFCYVLFAEIAYRLFLVSMLSRYFRQTWVIAGSVALISAMWPSPLLVVTPYSLGFLINFLLGLALTLIYLRFDFLTTVTAAVSLPLLLYGFSFTFAGKIVNPFHGWVLLTLPVLFIAGGQIIQRRGRAKIDTRVLQPDYLDRLAEKERMKRELEIARQVQLKFLPRGLPAIKGLDVAALCIPANEVGGDYYDFVKLGDYRLGVLVGDVSGKGILAAFYMTLAKGIIKSSIQENLSPAQVLIRANQLFYENVDRGIFVSLVYGVFDLEKRTFTSARAGHNPILLLRHHEQNATFVSSQGFALGLEHGELFRRNIQEQTVVINSGDVFVFYTDGFTEAMNSQ